MFTKFATTVGLALALILGGSPAAHALAPSVPPQGVVDVSLHAPKIPGKKAADKKITVAAPGKKFLPPPVLGKASSQVSARFVTVDKRVYGVGAQAITNIGACYNNTVANPQVTGAGNYHSLGEIAVQDTVNNDTLEFGWRKTNGGSTSLFGFHWDAGVPQGYNVDWVDVAANPINLGSAVTTGALKTFCMYYDPASGAWWASYDGAWVAYILASDVSTTPSNFVSGNYYQVFNEIAYQDDQNGNDADGIGDFTCVDMGDGRQGSAGVGNAAQFSSLTLQGGIPTSSVNMTVGTVGTIHSPAEFSVLKLSGRSFTSGGPGRNSTNTGTGTAGAC